MDKEYDYVDHLYKKYQGRVAIGVGYNQNLSEIYPLVFQNSDGESIGIVALGVIPNEKSVVHIYHLGAFISRRGDGSKILKELCRQADIFKIYLSVSAVFMPNGKDPQMDTKRLIKWYESFGFKGDSGLLRKPKTNNPC
ncbi:MAG: hypothetical protein ABIK98_08320 [Pseudomonadota bacterium]|uniref:N-acetyltransferase domain-containing protein n=1 Tax=Candidatus Desulfatibia profunda TaxID=2841695 RepID=A0A8J6TJ97_9BACT|nr:hypothetical protein [Candidatus Desulfatibia profunda]MBL7180175.1 hypothetical protein [Desulfobacterales bacterium]MBU0698476.1 GNAT family N-acetyltransferase [Pseudomonadota bacterium]